MCQILLEQTLGLIFDFISEDPNLAQFRALGYIAGFTDSEVSSRSDLYDVYVNLADSEITVSPVVKGWLLFIFWI